MVLNAKAAKKLRKIGRNTWKEFYRDIEDQPLRERLKVAWHIITRWKYKELHT